MAREAHGRLGRLVGAQLQGRRLPLRPHGPPQQGEHARGPRGSRRPDPQEGRRRRQVRSTSTARAGTSARSRTTRSSSQATQGQLGGTGIGTFSDRLRDAVRGGGPFDEDPRKQGFGSGEATDPNGAPINADGGRPPRARHRPRAARAGGQPQVLHVPSQSTGTRRQRHAGRLQRVARRVMPTSPTRSISYVDAHDNETLFDSLTYKLPVATSMQDRVRMNTLSLATTALAQTPSFWHAGADLLRSKSLNRDSLRQRRLVQPARLDRGRQRLRPRPAARGAELGQVAVHEAAARQPGAQADRSRRAQRPSAMAQDLLRASLQHQLFRLGIGRGDQRQGAASRCRARPMRTQGVIVMRIDDTVGRRRRPGPARRVVVFNATPSAVAQKVPGSHRPGGPQPGPGERRRQRRQVRGLRRRPRARSRCRLARWRSSSSR